MIALIAAIETNGCIGKDGALPWHLPEDLKHFKEMSVGKTVVMGRKTWESIPKQFRPLSDRQNIVVTRKMGYAVPAGVVVCDTIDMAIAKADHDVLIIGGADIYRQTIDIADTLYITRVHHEVVGDAFFPEIDPQVWHEAERHNRNVLSFVTYQKANG